MAISRLSKPSAAIIKVAAVLLTDVGGDAMLLLLDGPSDWRRIAELTGPTGKLTIVAADSEAELEGAAEAGLKPLPLNKEKAPLLERLQHALLEAAADEMIRPNGSVVAVYGGFQRGRFDSISHLQLDERMRRLTARDLQSLESSVPLKTVKAVVDLAVQIGREGREGKPVGAMFVVGDTRRVLQHCKDAGFDPMRGYQRKGRDLHDPRVREDIKEIAQMDGAFIVSSDAIVEKSRQIIEVMHENLSLSKGLGSRHWAGAAISQKTKAIAVVVSQSSGSVRLFQNGELVLRIEPMEQAVKWKEFNYEPPAETGD